MTNELRWRLLKEILAERESQPAFDDSKNTQGLWVSYITNYASRWAMPFSFCVERYSFRNCMIKAAALCLAALEWADGKDPESTPLKVCAPVAKAA